MSEIIYTCPCCGQEVKITIKDGGTVCASSFYMDGSEVQVGFDVTPSDFGFEFGEKGGGKSE